MRTTRPGNATLPVVFARQRSSFVKPSRVAAPRRQGIAWGFLESARYAHFFFFAASPSRPQGLRGENKETAGKGREKKVEHLVSPCVCVCAYRPRSPRSKIRSCGMWRARALKTAAVTSAKSGFAFGNVCLLFIIFFLPRLALVSAVLGASPIFPFRPSSFT